MTNAGVAGFPGGSSDGSIPLARLVASGGWGRLVSGRYYFPTGPQGSGLTTSASLGTGTLRLYPWVVPHTVALSVIGGEVTSNGDAGSKFRLGIYADSGNCYPGGLVIDAGTIAGDSSTVQDVAINVTLSGGLYWVGGAVQVVSVTQPTVRATTAPTPVPLSSGTSTPSANLQVSAYTQGSVTGALPAVFTSTVATASPAPRVHIKIA